jgi:hypothetical protein
LTVRKHVTEAITALALAALVLFSSSALAGQASRVDIARHSRIFAVLARRGPEKAAGLIDRRSLQMARGFAEALAEVYLERSPTDEIATFFAVFDSLPQDVRAERFAYESDTLTIKGTAGSSGGYAEFLDSLREHGRFAYVRGEHGAAPEGVAFAITCGLKA